MKKILLLALSVLLLSACVHKMDIQQGPILTQENVDRLHRGMTLAQVKDLLGPPLMLNTFNDNRVDYVYTYKPGHGTMSVKYVTLLFQGGTLRDIKGNMYSAFLKG